MLKKIFSLLIILLIPLILSGIYFYFFYSPKTSVQFNGSLRSYRLHFPVGGDPKTLKPLLVMLHGYGDSPLLSEIYTQFSSLADKQKFIVVYPYGTNGSEDGNLSWNAGFCCALAMRNNTDDVGYINFLVDTLSRQYPIDQNRIYIAGYSNGAMLAYRIIAEYPAKYAAVAAVAGTVAGSSFPNNIYYHIPDPVQPVSLITFHGEKDMIVPFLGGENIYKGQKGLAKFASFTQSVESVAKYDNCTMPVRSTPFSGVTLRTYSDCTRKSEILAYSLSGRGHIWPGGLFETSIYGSSLGADASSLIWDFFSGHPKTAN
jgi:polyhydroxybutyrate depolymerase